MPSSEEAATYPGMEIHSSTGVNLRELRNVDVFFCPEVFTHGAPLGSVVVGVYHSLPEALSFNHGSNLRSKPTVARHLDYMVIAVRQSEKQWQEKNYRGIQQIYPEEMLRERRSTLDIVPGGYPKLDYLQDIACSGASRYIVYAPTATLVPQSEIKRHGRQIIANLLERFPDFEIVFRPYPGNEPELVSDIEHEFVGNPRFLIDKTITGIGFLKDAALMVTDHSSVAISLSLATRIPSVFARFDAELDEEGKLGRLYT